MKAPPATRHPQPTTDMKHHNRITTIPTIGRWPAADIGLIERLARRYRRSQREVIGYLPAIPWPPPAAAAEPPVIRGLDGLVPLP